MASNAVTFPLPANCDPERIGKGFLLDGFLWFNEHTLCSALSLKSIPKSCVKSGDRRSMSWGGRNGFFVKDTVYWRLHIRKLGRATHRHWLEAIANQYGRGISVLPESERLRHG